MMHKPFPFTIKVILTLFAIFLTPIYWYEYGILNFLWFSDISLFLTVIALWLESSLLISIMAVSLLPIEIIWNTDFFVSLLFGYNISQMATYMFDPKYSLFLRGLSLFHVALPISWVWCLILWGYNRQAPKYAIAFIWVILLSTYAFSKTHENINWVFMPIIYNWPISQPAWLAILMIGVPVLVILPLHNLFKWLFIRKSK
jgi:hypothetical protein